MSYRYYRGLSCLNIVENALFGDDVKCASFMTYIKVAARQLKADFKFSFYTIFNYYSNKD